MSESINDRMEKFFKERPGEWIDGRVLAEHFGFYAWRSRCADVRRRGLNIRNRQSRLTRADGSTWVLSEYLYQPADLLEIAS